MASTPTQMWLHHHQCWTAIRCQVIAFLMDQPERRGSTGLLGGNSKQHALFGVSCDFGNLTQPFAACPPCCVKAQIYFSLAKFALPIAYNCPNCHSYSLPSLLEDGKRKKDVLPWLSAKAPGHILTSRPGTITFKLLIAGWHYAVTQFVVTRQWTQPQVEAYFGLLCINRATTDHFTQCCRNYILVQHMAIDPDAYSDEM